MDKTDATLKTLERQIKSVYTKAYQEMKKEASDILAKIEINPDMPLAQKMALMTKYDRLNTLSTQLANTAYSANSTAQRMINNEMVNIYDINYNGDAERLGFGLIDHTAIKKILKEEENPFNMISSLRDKEGIRNQMKGELMQSLLKGESIQKMATRLKNVSEKSLKDSIRIARTETTRVQNSAKMDIGKHGQELGFDMWKRWVATTDGRVRDDHLRMDGVEVPQDEPFVLPDGSKMMFPADISLGADAGQVINCRCTVVEFIKRDENGNLVMKGEENKQEIEDDTIGGLTMIDKDKDFTRTTTFADANLKLREGGKLSVQEKEIVKQADDSMQTIKSDIKLYRGTRDVIENGVFTADEKSEWKSYEDVAKSWIGKTFEDSGFVFTSTDKDATRDYTSDYILNITAKKGTKAVWGTGSVGNEIILGRNQKFKVVGAKVDKNNRIILDVEVD